MLNTGRVSQINYDYKKFKGDKRTRVKICELRRPVDMEYMNKIDVDYAGFVFVPPSPTHVTVEEAQVLRDALDPYIPSVGVFFNAPVEEVAAVCEAGIIDCVQLHGTEDNEYIANLRALTKAPLIKVVRVADGWVEAANACTADFLIVDGRVQGLEKSFSWDTVDEDMAALEKPFFLFGNIAKEDAPALIAKYKPYGIDICSELMIDSFMDEEKIDEYMEVLKG